jgi:hypothetical protein
MGPARTTILRNVLVADVGKEVSIIDIVPNPGVRDLVCGNKCFFNNILRFLGKWNTAGLIWSCTSWNSSSHTNKGDYGK